MSQPVKKPYNSALRAAQARATRRAIVDAAARLFIAHGYGATTVDAIAAAAGVSRKTVFTSVGGKSEALKLAMDWAIAGDDEPVPILERPHVRAQMQEPDARRMLASYARHVREVGARIAPLHEAVRAAAGLDEEIRALAEEGGAQRIRGMRVLAQRLADRGALKPGLTPSEAADVLWLLNDPGVYYRLVIEQHWDPDRYQDWLADSLISLLIPVSYQPESALRPRANVTVGAKSMPRIHSYDIAVTWTGNRGTGTSGYRAYGRDHDVIAEGRPVIAASSEPLFRGDPARWNPELELVAALSQCHMLWYLHLCAAAGVIVTSYSDHAGGTMAEADDGGGRFTEVVLRPQVSVASAQMTETAVSLHKEAHAKCFIANSVNFTVRHEPVVTVAGPAPA